MPTPQPSPHAGRVRCSTPVDGGGYTNRRAKVHKKQQLTTPSCRFPPASKGEPTPCAVPLAKRGEPTEGAIVNFGAQLVLVALASCVYPLLQAGEGGCVDGRTAVRPYDLPRGNCAGRTPCAPTTLSHAEIVQGELPFAPTTLSHAENVQGERRSPLRPSPARKMCRANAVRPYTPHSVGEGLRVRAKLKTAARRPTWRPARVLSRTCRLAPSRRRSPPGARARSASSSPRRSVF